MWVHRKRTDDRADVYAHLRGHGLPQRAKGGHGVSAAQRHLAQQHGGVHAGRARLRRPGRDDVNGPHGLDWAAGGWGLHRKD